MKPQHATSPLVPDTPPKPLPPADPYPTEWDAEEPPPKRKQPSDIRDRGVLDSVGHAVIDPVIDAGRHPVREPKESDGHPQAGR